MGTEDLIGTELDAARAQGLKFVIEMSPERQALVQKGRLPCPKCGAKGVGYAPHPHAYGWKDYGRLVCRYCSARFKIKEPKND